MRPWGIQWKILVGCRAEWMNNGKEPQHDMEEDTDGGQCRKSDSLEAGIGVTSEFWPMRDIEGC